MASDVVVRAHLAYGGWIAAEECGIPCVTVGEAASGVEDWERENMSDTPQLRGANGAAWRVTPSCPDCIDT